MSTRLRTRLLIATGALLAAGGCRAAVERVFTPPTAALRGVEVVGVGVQGAAIAVTLALVNPNPFPLAASGASYRLLVGDSVEVGRGTTATALRVGGNDSTTIRLPVDVSWSGLGRAGRGALRGGTVDFRIIGEVIASTPLGDRAVPIDARGRFAALGPR